ncbi:MAG: cupin [Rhodobacterales bacterium]|nr:cupin [Rhodobacterales bacterium]
MSNITYLRIYSGPDGCSHLEDRTVGLAGSDYAPPAVPLFTSTPETATTTLFLELPVGWYGEWHPTPVRQWLILMTGALEFEAGDGAFRQSVAGDVVLLDDLTGPGHQTRVLGDTAVRIAAIHLPADGPLPE